MTVWDAVNCHRALSGLWHMALYFMVCVGDFGCTKSDTVQQKTETP